MTARSGVPGEKDVVAAVVPQYLQVVNIIPKTGSDKPQERLLIEAFATHPQRLFVEGMPR